VRRPADARPACAGILASLGYHDRARTVRIAGAMIAGRSYTQHLRAVRPARQRTGRSWREQQRDGSGRFVAGWTS
jgi:hypothetical protein